MSAKMCDVCGEAPAVVHLKEFDDKNVVDVDLCQSCADARGYAPSSSTSAGGLQDLAEKLVEMAKELSGKRETDGIRCASCGLLYSEFSKAGRLGCPACYEAFIGQLKPILRKTHGAVAHIGRRPSEDGRVREERRELRRLRTDLGRAVRREDYEEAARLRDVIAEREEVVKPRPAEEGL